MQIISYSNKGRVSRAGRNDCVTANDKAATVQQFVDCDGHPHLIVEGTDAATGRTYQVLLSTRESVSLTATVMNSHGKCAQQLRSKVRGEELV